MSVDTLTRIADGISGINRLIGALLGWAALTLVLAQISIIILTNVFRVGSIELQESLLYINSLIFLGAAGYTLAEDAHVRVDVFYRTASERTKAIINLAGTVFLLFPMLWLLARFGIPFVLSSWEVREGSTETTGLQGIYLFKSLILLFVILVGLQGISLALRSIIVLTRNRS